MHTVTALLCFVVVIHWLIFPYPSGLLHWHCGNLTIAPVSAKQPWWIWINTSCEFIMNDCITTTKQSTTTPCAYFLGYTVRITGICLAEHNIPSFWSRTLLSQSVAMNLSVILTFCLSIAFKIVTSRPVSAMTVYLWRILSTSSFISPTIFART